MMERLGPVTVVRVAHVIAELDELVGVLVCAGNTARRRLPHQRTAATRERRQTSCRAPQPQLT